MDAGAFAASIESALEAQGHEEYDEHLTAFDPSLCYNDFEDSESEDDGDTWRELAQPVAPCPAAFSPPDDAFLEILRASRHDAALENSGENGVIEYSDLGHTLLKDQRLSCYHAEMKKHRNLNVWIVAHHAKLQGNGHANSRFEMWPPRCVNPHCDSPCTLEVPMNYNSSGGGAATSFVCGNCGTVLANTCFESDLRDPNDTLGLQYTTRDEDGKIIAHDNMQREPDFERPADLGSFTSGATRSQEKTLRRWLRRGDAKVEGVFLDRNSSDPAAIAASIRKRIQFVLNGLRHHSPVTESRACLLAAAFVQHEAKQKQLCGRFLQINRAVQFNNIANAAICRAAMQGGVAFSVRDFVKVSRSAGIPCTPRVVRSWYKRLMEALDLKPFGAEQALFGFAQRCLYLPEVALRKGEREPQIDFNRREMREVNDVRLLSEWAAALQPRDLPDYKEERRQMREQRRREAKEQAGREKATKIKHKRDRVPRKVLVRQLDDALERLREYTKKHGDFLPVPSTYLVLGHTAAVLGTAIAYVIIQRRGIGRVSMQRMEKLTGIDKMSIQRAKRTLMHFLVKVH